MVQVRKFEPLVPEPAPALPKGMPNADHERHHGGGSHGSEGGKETSHGEAPAH